MCKRTTVPKLTNNYNSKSVEDTFRFRVANERISKISDNDENEHEQL